MDEPSQSCPAPLLPSLGVPELLNSLADGAYITDVNRKIMSWNRAAERITGWPAAEVIGKSCFDDILARVDKDAHALCGHEHCPLHRSIVTEQASTEPLLVFARRQSGARIPVEATVSPIRNPEGCVVGGDSFRVERHGTDRYAILLADAMGHGVAAALYTMLLRSFWDEHRVDLESPARFLNVVNERLHTLVRESGCFSTGLCATYDAVSGQLRCVRAGHPSPLLFRAAGTVEPLGGAQPALGMFPDFHYQETATRLEPGDTLLLFTDAAVELFDAAEHELGVEGLKRLVREQTGDTVAAGFHPEKLEEQLLRFSNQIHLPDDLTLLKLRRRS